MPLCERRALSCPLQEATPGARAHGFVTGTQDYGVFVSFCNGVKGLVPLDQLCLEPGKDPATHFPIGKVQNKHRACPSQLQRPGICHNACCEK